MKFFQRKSYKIIGKSVINHIFKRKQIKISCFLHYKSILTGNYTDFWDGYSALDQNNAKNIEFVFFACYTENIQKINGEIL